MSLIASTLSAAAGDRVPTWRAFDLITDASADAVDLINNAGAGPSGIHVRADVPRLYISDDNGDTISEWAFIDSSRLWDISDGNIYRVSISSTLSQDTLLQDFSFSPDGTKLFTIGSSTDYIYSYTLTVPWDLSTITYDGNTDLGRFLVGTGGVGETLPLGLFVKPDGTRLWFVGSALDTVYQYDLISPWDLSTIGSSATATRAAGDSTPTGLTFSSDGTKMYISGDASNAVDQINLNSAWDISGNPTQAASLNVNAEVAVPDGIAFNPDGTKMYIVGSSELNQYTTG